MTHIYIFYQLYSPLYSFKICHSLYTLQNMPPFHPFWSTQYRISPLGEYMHMDGYYRSNHHVSYET